MEWIMGLSVTKQDLCQVMEQLPAPMYISSNDPKNMHSFLYVNEALVTHSGYSREELAKMIVFDLIDPDRLQQEPIDHNDTMAKGFVKMESIHRTKDGKRVPVLTFIRIITLDSGEKITLGFFHDLTAQHETKQKLNKTYQQFDSLFLHNPDFAYILDRDGYFTQINDAGLELLQYSREEIESMRYSDLIIEDDFPLVRAAFAQVLTKEIVRPFVRIRNRKGDIIELDVTAVPIIQQDEVMGVIGIARDVTAQNKTYADLSESRQQYRSLFENNIDAVLTFDLCGKFQYVNPATENMMGYTKEELIGASFLPHIVEDRKTQTIRRFSKVLEGNAIQYETAMYTKSNDIVELHVTVIPIMVDGVVTGIHCIGKDITEKKQLEQKLKEMAFYDLLTELPNQHRFQQHLTKLLHQYEQSNNQSFAVLFLDLDRFKAVNDAFGHEVGDALLKELAARLMTRMPLNARVFRYGGDELIMTLEGVGEQEAQSVAGQVIKLLKEPFSVGEVEISTSTSIGISFFPQDGCDRETLIRKADHAMYFAKRNGKGQYQLYSTAVKQMSDRYFNMEPMLRKAIQKNELSLMYQPQICLDDHRVYGVEALLRWTNDEIGPVSPGDFIPVAEESGLIVEIGAWVMRESCRQLVEWDNVGLSPERVSVNVSVRQFFQSDFVDTVRDIIHETGIHPDRLVLEITESVASNAEMVLGILQQLKTLGVSVSIDDFGTGYSSLQYLKEFPIDCLKIDQSFIRSIDDGTKGRDIVATIITLAHNLGLKTIAEGTESAVHVAYLQEKGCEIAQGYFFSRPLQPDDFREWYRQWSK